MRASALLVLVLRCGLGLAAIVPGGNQSNDWTHSPRAYYPALARAARIEGKVRIRVFLSKDGAVEALQALSGHPLLIPAAMDAVRTWRHRPMAEPASEDVTLRFALSRENKMVQLAPIHPHAR
jgi:protein TonB